MSQDLKERNATLKALIDKESNLGERINNQLEATLEAAVREKMQTSQLLNESRNELLMKKEEHDELQYSIETLKGKSK